MSRYKQMFKKLNKEICLVPFVTLGDPSIKLSLKIIDTLIDNGANAIEVGIPFSDPIADGNIIQKANIRALKNNINVQDCFNMLNIIRQKHHNIPIGILTYANLIYNFGIQNFFFKCEENYIDSILIADVPLEEYKNFMNKIIINNISVIFTCPVDSKKKLIKKIINFKPEYIYLLSRSGITGIHQKINYNIIKKTILKIKKYTNIPILQGFGIYNENQIKKSIYNKCDGVICGSVFVQIIKKNISNDKLLLKKIKSKVKQLKRSTYII
ncbi:tryptophan synthase subunit alpha [Buchnera aphidicola (Taiwanaphis decaspermi)]|uniref:tryptophan synthase subunit alpha n=1 Tax=Buchnera aphidicola TaxID=9 RepID=UPI0031B87871